MSVVSLNYEDIDPQTRFFFVKRLCWLQATWHLRFSTIRRRQEKIEEDLFQLAKPWCFWDFRVPFPACLESTGVRERDGSRFLRSSCDNVDSYQPAKNVAATGVIGDCLLHLADENWMSGAEDHSGRGVTSSVCRLTICRTLHPTIL